MLMGLLLQAAVAFGAAGPEPTDLVPRVVVTATVAESVTQRRLDGAVDWPRLQDTLRTGRPARAVESSDFHTNA